MAAHRPGMQATYQPGYDDTYYTPPAAPELISPEPQRHMPEMSSQIQHGLQNMTLDHRESVLSSISHDQPLQPGTLELPRFSPFPKLKNPPANVPPSDDEFEETLWNARNLVLDSTDPEMQLAWAADALIYVGTAADNEERAAAAKPGSARSSTPQIEHALKTDAMSIVTFLSGQHHPKAEFLRGQWLEWGRYGQREDKKEAFRCYSRAADKGYARADYRIGMIYESFNDVPKALRHYHRGVDAGDSASCYRLGMMTLRGQHGQQQDFQHGMELIKQSADTADENAAQGAYVYGMLLSKQLPQIIVPDHILQPDEMKARTYIEKAAFLRFAKAQLKMGSCYELGAMGCQFDPALSIHYYALAARQGEAEADMALSKWFLVGHEGLFPKNEDLSFTYAERAAATGLATAEFAMGYFYEIGMCVPVNTKKSMEWYEKAAEHGNDDAKGRIEALEKKQFLSKKDHENVAIHRIKSMHNSKGGRPERKPAAPPKMPALPEAHNGFPPRLQSVAPYPTDDRPSPLSARPGSAAPYPINDTPSSAYADSPGGTWQQPPRPATTTYMDNRQHLPPPGPAYGSPHPPQGFQNQYQGPPPRSPQPGGYPPSGRPMQGQRIVSSPGNMQHGQGYSPQSTPRPGQYPPSAPGTPYQGGSPRPPQGPMRPQDIGYSAPPDNRRYNPGPPQQGRPAQGHLPPSQSAPNMGRPPQGAGSGPPPRPPAKDAAPAAPAKPKPKPGPTTFEQMGVQTKKDGDDCVVM